MESVAGKAPELITAHKIRKCVLNAWRTIELYNELLSWGLFARFHLYSVSWVCFYVTSCQFLKRFVHEISGEAMSVCPSEYIMSKNFEWISKTFESWVYAFSCLRILFWFGPTQPSIQRVPGALSVGQSGRGVKLTTHLHLSPGLRMRGDIPPYPIFLHDVVLS
jgi:hypothetical protein